MISTRLGIGVAAMAVGVAVAGCSTGSGVTPSSVPTAQHRTTATHWWSTTDYCGILRQTLQAGHSILPNVSASDPDLLAATTAFTADLTSAAPASVRKQWLVLAPALTELVRSGGKLSAVSGVNSRLVAAAATAIATDAKARCHVDLGA